MNEKIENLEDNEVINKEEIKKKYPKVYEIEIENEDLEQTFTYYFMKPSTPSFNRALKTMSKQSLQAMNDFTTDNIIPELLEKYKEDIKNYPALAFTAGQKLMGLLGLSDTVTVKKL